MVPSAWSWKRVDGVRCSHRSVAIILPGTGQWVGQGRSLFQLELSRRAACVQPVPWTVSRLPSSVESSSIRSALLWIKSANNSTFQVFSLVSAKWQTLPWTSIVTRQSKSSSLRTVGITVNCFVFVIVLSLSSRVRFKTDISVLTFVSIK